MSSVKTWKKRGNLLINNEIAIVPELGSRSRETDLTDKKERLNFIVVVDGVTVQNGPAGDFFFGSLLTIKITSLSIRNITCTG
jgi:hypothetical protein